MYDEDGVLRRVVVRSPYNFDVEAVSRETSLVCNDASRAQQKFKEECDINTIIDRFGLGAQIPMNARVPITEEFVEARIS